MDYRTFNKLKLFTAVFVAATIVLAVLVGNVFWGLIGISIGLVFINTVKRKTKTVIVDERIITIGQKAAQLSFNIITVSMGICSVLLVITSQNKFAYPESLGIILSYLTMFSLLVYTASYYYCANSDEDEK